MRPCELTLTAAASEVREGRISSVDLVKDCLARIGERDGDIQAWAHLDPDDALRQAALTDQKRAAAGKSAGLLDGVPIGVKDLFDTADVPTEYGTPIWQGHMPARDATAVARLRAAGAVVIGKTVTTEYAFLQPSKTRNPHDAKHTPGGSSAGSAAAVASGMVPGAIGTQTNGSVIRPASFCGIVGFKPTHGLISRAGAMMLSRTLDHVGTFARTVEDAALLAQALVGLDERDPDTRDHAQLPFAGVARSAPPRPPRLAFVRTAVWDKADGETRAAFEQLASSLGAQAEEVVLGEAFADAVAMQGMIMEIEMAHNLRHDHRRGADQMSAALLAKLEAGRKHSAVAYLAATRAIGPLNAALQKRLDGFDAIITPAAPGAAPAGLETTGDPVFCSTWTLLGTPAVTVPLLRARSGLPIGVQLVGRRYDDARLLRCARWLTDWMEKAAPASGKTSAKGRTAGKVASKAKAPAKAGKAKA